MQKPQQTQAADTSTKPAAMLPTKGVVIAFPKLLKRLHTAKAIDVQRGDGKPTRLQAIIQRESKQTRAKKMFCAAFLNGDFDKPAAPAAEV